MIKVQLHKNNNDDTLVVNAARASFAESADKFTEERNNRLIQYLAREKHVNPFFHPRFTFMMDVGDIELWWLSPNQINGMVWHKHCGEVMVRHSFYGWLNLLPYLTSGAENVLDTLFKNMPESSKAFGFHASFDHDCSIKYDHPAFIDVSLYVEAPIFLARQEYTHKVGFTRSERSGRYVSSTPDMFMPSEWREKPEDGIKQGSGSCSRSTGTAKTIAEQTNKGSITSYEWLLRANIAPEQARMLLPQAMMTKYMVTGSLSAFRRMHTERTNPNAQKEIQDYAHMVDEILTTEYGSNWGE